MKRTAWLHVTFLVTLTLALTSPERAEALDFDLWGKELSFSGTNTLRYTYHTDNDSDSDARTAVDDKYHQVFNTLDVNLSAGDVRLGGRFDFHLFADRPFSRHCGDGAATPQPGWCNQSDGRYVNQYFLYRKKAILPERLFLTVARPEFDLTLGDFYASFGKGIALHAVKRDELGQDTTIFGGKVELHHADFNLTFLAGEFNPINIDSDTGKVANWNIEPVIAGRMEYRFFDALLAGAHAVWIASEDEALASSKARTDHNAVWGLSLEASDLADVLSVAAEVDLQRTVAFGEITRGPDAEDFAGLAAYANATLSLGRWSLIAELKHYDDFVLKAAQWREEPYELAYHQPPTLERLKAEVGNNQHATGSRLRVDFSINDDLLLLASYAFFKTEEDADHEVHDPFVGVEWTWQEGDGHFNLTTGVRYERNTAQDHTERIDVHVDLDIEQAIHAGHSMKLTAFYQHRRKRVLELDDWNELDTALEYKWSPHLAAGLTVELQSDASVGHENKVYLGGSLRYYVNPGTYVGVRIGQNRGGIKCLNGTCRLFPPFAGARIYGVARW